MYCELKYTVVELVHSEELQVYRKEGNLMATKSILKNININEKHLGRNFVSAMENAKNKTYKDVVLSKSCSVLKRDQIKSLFGAKSE